MSRIFTGKWITTDEFSRLNPRNVFHKQLDKVDLPCTEHRNRHILFRKHFCLNALPKNAKIFISADDYYKLYINGRFVAQGPAPAYHFQYNYNEIDVGEYLQAGENLIAVHTLYQGLINRVWQSGDFRHGLIFDLETEGRIVVSSDETCKTAYHTGYAETGVVGYDTQFLETYDSAAPEVGFEGTDFDDSAWENAQISQVADHTLTAQKTAMLEFENITPVRTLVRGNRVFCDFGSVYVGYLTAVAQGKQGDCVRVCCAQEVVENDELRPVLRAFQIWQNPGQPPIRSNTAYQEDWLLGSGSSKLDWFDYKAFRYAEFTLPEGATLQKITLVARHYPFHLNTKMNPAFARLEKVWELVVHSQQYGVQEVIQDCMDREKGFYVGDGCYSALANMVLTGDDAMVRKLIDDAFASEFITDTLVTCLDCSFMQEIAEYPLILIYLILWHYNFTGDRAYLQSNYPKVTKLLDIYRRNYETEGLLRNLDRWCVVEWPKNYRHGYDVDITEGQVCKDAHVAINAYYITAIRAANAMATALDLPAYRDETPLLSAFTDTFYDAEQKLFWDGENTRHISLVGNSFVYAFGLCKEEAFKTNFMALLKNLGIASLSFYTVFPLLMCFAREGRTEDLLYVLSDDGTWPRMLREGATTTFEGWGKDVKWNTSTFHLTLTYAAIFMADIDLQKLFSGI